MRVVTVTHTAGSRLTTSHSRCNRKPWHTKEVRGLTESRPGQNVAAPLAQGSTAARHHHRVPPGRYARLPSLDRQSSLAATACAPLTLQLEALGDAAAGLQQLLRKEREEECFVSIYTDGCIFNFLPMPYCRREALPQNLPVLADGTATHCGARPEPCCRACLQPTPLADTEEDPVGYRASR